MAVQQKNGRGEPRLGRTTDIPANGQYTHCFPDSFSILLPWCRVGEQQLDYRL